MLTTKTVELIKTDSNLRARLMLVDSKSEYTIKRWIEANSPTNPLCLPVYTAVISEHTGFHLNDILEGTVKESA